MTRDSQPPSVAGTGGATPLGATLPAAGGISEAAMRLALVVVMVVGCGAEGGGLDIDGVTGVGSDGCFHPARQLACPTGASLVEYDYDDGARGVTCVLPSLPAGERPAPPHLDGGHQQWSADGVLLVAAYFPAGSLSPLGYAAHYSSDGTLEAVQCAAPPGSHESWTERAEETCAGLPGQPRDPDCAETPAELETFLCRPCAGVTAP